MTRWSVYGPFRRKGRRVWDYGLYDRVTRATHTRSTHQVDFKLAKRVVDDIRLKALQRQLSSSLRTLTWEVAWDEWTTELETTGRAEATLASLESTRRVWAPRFEGKLVEEIRREDALEYFAARRRDAIQPSTLNRELHTMRNFWRWCLRRQYVSENIAATIPTFKEPEREIRVLTPLQERELLCRLDATTRTLVLVAIETGLRSRTLLSLQWEHLSEDGRWLHLPPEILKGRRAMRVPLSARARQALSNYREAVTGLMFDVPPRSMRKQIEWASKRAGIAFTLHDARRTFLTRCRQRGVPLEVAMALSGHKSVKVVLKCYRHIDDADLLRAVGDGPPEEEKENGSA